MHTLLSVSSSDPHTDRVQNSSHLHLLTPDRTFLKMCYVPLWVSDPWIPDILTLEHVCVSIFCFVV